MRAGEEVSRRPSREAPAEEPKKAPSSRFSPEPQPQPQPSPLPPTITPTTSPKPRRTTEPPPNPKQEAFSAKDLKAKRERKKGSLLGDFDVDEDSGVPVSEQLKQARYPSPHCSSNRSPNPSSNPNPSLTSVPSPSPSSSRRSSRTRPA